jgi:hypothetical protein
MRDDMRRQETFFPAVCRPKKGGSIMDPVAIGVAVGTALISKLTKGLMESAADPEKVARSVNWLFSAASHFFKIRKKEIPRDEPIPAPPENTALEKPPAEITDADIEKKTAAVEKIAKSLPNEAPMKTGGKVRLASLDDFTAGQLAAEIDSLMTQTSTYLGNLRFEEEKAAQFGGLAFAPPIVMNMIRIQREEIAKRVLRLNDNIEKLYGVSAPNLDTLVTVAKSRS